MQPVRLIWKSTADLLASDTATLAAVAALHVHLAAAPFTPGLDLALVDLTEASFTGSAPKNAGTGTQPTYYDALTGDLTLRILEPAGGWSWVCTVNPGAPETVYGVYLTDNTDADLYGAQLLDQPVTIAAAGHGLSIGEIKLTFSQTSPN